MVPQNLVVKLQPLRVIITKASEVIANSEPSILPGTLEIEDK